MSNKFLLLTLAISTLLLSPFGFTAPANNVHMIPQLVGGLDYYDSHFCQQQLQSQCTDMQCRLNIMSKYPSCKQTLAINKQALGFQLIKSKGYGSVDVIYANVIGADYSSQYFMITQTGEFITPTSTVNLSMITKQYRQAMLLSSVMGGFPQTSCLPNGGNVLMFKQAVTQGCAACKRLGVATVGYGFNKSGKYLGAELLKFTAST